MTLEEVARIAHISQRLANDLRVFFGHLDYVTACVDSQQSTSFHQIPSQTPAPTISLEIIASIATTVMATMKQAMQLLAPNLLPFFTSPSTLKLPNRFKKLPDIPEYDKDMEKLDAWEQQLIQ